MTPPDVQYRLCIPYPWGVNRYRKRDAVKALVALAAAEIHRDRLLDMSTPTPPDHPYLERRTVTDWTRVEVVEDLEVDV